MPDRRYHLAVRLPLILICVSLVLVGIFSKRGWVDWVRIRDQNRQLSEKIEQARARKSDVERRLDTLIRDPQAQQSAVRQYLGYIREDEIIIELP